MEGEWDHGGPAAVRREAPSWGSVLGCVCVPYVEFGESGSRSTTTTMMMISGESGIVGKLWDTQ